MIGHLAPIKGTEDFIRAAAVVCAGRDDVEFIIAGEDKSRDGEHRRSLEGLIDELSLTKRVRLIGWVDDVAKLLPTFDLFVSPSRSEPFGLSIIEAMAAACPLLPAGPKARARLSTITGLVAWSRSGTRTLWRKRLANYYQTGKNAIVLVRMLSVSCANASRWNECWKRPSRFIAKGLRQDRAGVRRSSGNVRAALLLLDLSREQLDFRGVHR